MNWNQWFDEVIEKAEQLGLFGGPRLTVAAKTPEERQIAPRTEPSTAPTAKPKRKLIVPPKSGHKPPAGGGWRRTPNGWARGHGDNYRWEPFDWEAKTAGSEKPIPKSEEFKVRYWEKNGWKSTILIDSKEMKQKWDQPNRWVVRGEIPESHHEPQTDAGGIPTLGIGDDVDGDAPGVVVGKRLRHHKATGRVLEYLVKPKPKTKPKKDPSTVDVALDLAKKYGIPAEKSGARSIAIGGAAAFDRDLGKWNRQRGSDGRRIASAAKVLAWLQSHGEDTKKKQEKKSEFKDEMSQRRSQGLVLRGNTYPHREAIKAAGGVWDRMEKVWLMPSREALVAMKEKMATPQPSPQRDRPIAESREPRKATPKQVEYAMGLIDKLYYDDYGTLTTYGYQNVTPEKLKKMSTANVSAMIDHLREELFDA